MHTQKRTVTLAVLSGSASSFITQFHFEFSNYTQAQYFTEINLLPALRTGLFYLALSRHISLR